MDRDAVTGRDGGSTADAADPATYVVCGVRIAAVTPEQASRLVVQRAVAGTGTQAHLCNAFTLSLVDEPQLRGALQNADLNLPDGTPVAWLGRRAGTRGPVRGPDLVDHVARDSVGTGVGHFFWGGAEGVAQRAARALEERHPGLVVSGCVSPPFGPLSPELLDEAARQVRESGARIVWVGLGTPKQDLAVPGLAERLPHAVVVPVGAAFDFWAGTVKMAPTWLQGTGLEWIYRLAQEPRRLWRRYLVGNPRFMWKVIRERASRRTPPPGGTTR